VVTITVGRAEAVSQNFNQLEYTMEAGDEEYDGERSFVVWTSSPLVEHLRARVAWAFSGPVRSGPLAMERLEGTPPRGRP